jgi:hypothetical protein
VLCGDIGKRTPDLLRANSRLSQPFPVAELPCDAVGSFRCRLVSGSLLYFSGVRTLRIEGSRLA